MTSFDFDVISDRPAPRVIQPAAVPAANTPPQEAAPAPREEIVPRSDAA